MQAVAHNPAFAKKAGVPQSVGKEFTKSGGGMAESKKMVGKEIAFMKKKGAPKSMVKHEMKEAGMKYGGKVKKMAGGGEPLPPPPDEVELPKDMFKKKKVKMASGGLAAGHKSADGVAHKGKTKAKKVVMTGAKGMKSGGSTKKYC